MALIQCPECEAQASDRARACPTCGFPIAETIEKDLAEVTGHDRIRTARQRAAADKLKSWGEGYLGESMTPAEPKGFFARHHRVLLGVLVAAMVVLQIYVLFYAIYE